jgi:hypothetical protein
MDDNDVRVAEQLRTMQVGDTIRIRMEKSKVGAEVRDRVSLIVAPLTDPDGPGALQGFTKDASGMWDLESLTSGKDNPVVEVILRRAASDI